MGARRKTEPTEPHHLKLVDALVENGGNVPAAAEAAGMTYINASKTIERYKEFILDKIDSSLVLHGLKAAKVMVDTLSDDGTIPGGKLRLDASQQVLDRIGVAKKERIELKVESEHGLFILPRKDIEDGNEEA